MINCDFKNGYGIQCSALVTFDLTNPSINECKCFRYYNTYLFFKSCRYYRYIMEILYIHLLVGHIVSSEILIINTELFNYKYHYLYLFKVFANSIKIESPLLRYVVISLSISVAADIGLPAFLVLKLM